MQPTRRTWTAAAVAVSLAIMAPIVASPVPVVGTALVFGWLIAHQIATVRQFQTTVDATTITVEPAATELQVGTEIPVTTGLKRPPGAADTELTVTIPIPVAATLVDETNRQLTLAVGETRATTTMVLSMPTAGRMQFPEPRWELVDTHSSFTESFDRGPHQQ